MENKEIKTLKDMEVGKCSSYNIIAKGKQCDDKECITCGYAKELKQEAIKRAKYFDNKMQKLDAGEIEEMGFIYWKGRFDEVIEANNLTEEDLK